VVKLWIKKDMIKTLIILIVFKASIFGVDFNTFLNEALVKSAYLQFSSIAKQQAKEEQSKILRYANPKLGFASSRFNPINSKSDNGYSVSVMQPIRLWDVSDDKKSLSDAKIANVVAQTFFIKADFIRNLSFLFIQYAKDRDLARLSKEEQTIAKKIFDISNERFKNGTISRGKMLQAKIAYEVVLTKNIVLSLQENRSYFELLKYSGLNEQIDIDTNHIFKVINKRDSANPNILTLKTEQKVSLASAELASNKIETFSITAEFEEEIDQDIYRVGISVPLPIFNSKNEERAVAKLESQKKELLVENEEKRVSLSKSYLKKERTLLKELQNRNIAMIVDEERLLSMFEEAYKIASVNLIELQDIKNRVIETKKSFIENKTALNKNAIEQNYLQGAYNE